MMGMRSWHACPPPVAGPLGRTRWQRKGQASCSNLRIGIVLTLSADIVFDMLKLPVLLVKVSSATKIELFRFGEVFGLAGFGRKGTLFVVHMLFNGLAWVQERHAVHSRVMLHIKERHSPQFSTSMPQTEQIPATETVVAAP